MNPFILILVIMGVVVIGGGGVLFVWYMVRPIKQSWNAKVYQLMEGIRPPIKDRKGNIISEVKKQDLKPYALDTIQKVQLQPGIISWKLLRLNKPVPAITNDVVDYWGKKNKEVACLLHEDSVTLLRKGYDRNAGEILFDPLQYDRKMMLQTEMTMRRARLDNKKGLWEKLALYVTIGILVLGLVAVAYFQGNSAIKVSESNLEAAKLLSRNWGGSGTEPVEPEIIKEDPPLIDAG